MLGHNANEGLASSDPFVSNDTAYTTSIESTFLGASWEVASYITDELHPPPSNATSYKDTLGRNALGISESTFVCNTLYLDRVSLEIGRRCVT